MTGVARVARVEWKGRWAAARVGRVATAGWTAAPMAVVVLAAVVEKADSVELAEALLLRFSIRVPVLVLHFP